MTNVLHEITPRSGSNKRRRSAGANSEIKRHHPTEGNSATKRDRSSGANYQTSGSVGSYCMYPRCVKTPHENQRFSMHQRKFCGELHRDMFMSNLAEGKSASTITSHTEEMTPTSKCMLPSCTNRVSRDSETGQNFDFCGKSHMLEMVEEQTKLWSQKGRLCMLNDCCRHVNVKDDGTCYQYCSIKHARLAVARKAVKQLPMSETATLKPGLHAVEDGRSSDHRVDNDALALVERHGNGDEQRSHDSSPCQALTSAIASEQGYHDKIGDAEMVRLLKGGSDDVHGPTILRGVDPYKYHPWELVDNNKFEGFKPRYIIGSVKKQQRQNGRSAQKRTTKENFAYKQSGPTHSSEKNLQKRYFKYQLTGSGGKLENLPHVEVYTMFDMQREEEKKKRKEKRERKMSLPGTVEKNRKKGQGSKYRWGMHEIMLAHEDSESDSRMIIWMIFQEEQGEPVWPPRVQPKGAVPTEESKDNTVLFNLHREPTEGVRPWNAIDSLQKPEIAESDWVSFHAGDISDDTLSVSVNSKEDSQSLGLNWMFDEVYTWIEHKPIEEKPPSDDNLWVT